MGLVDNIRDPVARYWIMHWIMYMFIESGSALVNCSPLAGDLQLTGVRVLFNKFCGAPPMIVGT